MSDNDKQINSKLEFTVEGIPTSPGFAIGPVFIYSEPTYSPELRVIPRKRVDTELRRFEKSILKSRQFLQKIFEETEATYGHEFAEVIQTQISILDDQIFLDEVKQLILERHFDAAYATFKIFRKKKEHFLKLSDEYFRDRAFDVQNLKRLILKNMLGRPLEVSLRKRSIIAADDLSPADTVRLHYKNILGFCTNFGGKNSHTAIIARSLGVPAVVGTEVITNAVKPGDQIILDGIDGLIIVHPSRQTINQYRRKIEAYLDQEKKLLKKADRPAQTRDGHIIQVMANIEFVQELDQIKKSGAEGIGLYRTEGLFFGDNGLPSEEIQTENYLKIATAMKPHTVVVRTLDIGGDKLLPELVSIPERNPFLGWRAIRFCLDHKEIFIPQLKAILRANVHKNLHILLPMVSSLDEIRQFKDVLAEVVDLLKNEEQPFCPDTKIGTMIEIPAAAILAESFAAEVDFFSIGTNDLVQYTLAVDRANERISRLYDHFHPALLRLIEQILRVGKSAQIPVSMCGEMASDPVAIPLLLGMGLSNFSVVHKAIPEVKNVICNVSMETCRELSQEIKNMKTASQVKTACEKFYAKLFTGSQNQPVKKSGLNAATKN